VVFKVSLSGASDQAVTVQLSAEDGNATGGATDNGTNDYNNAQFYLDAAGTQAISGNVLTIDAGQTSVNVYVLTFDNDPPYNEPNETFNLKLSDPVSNERTVP